MFTVINIWNLNSVLAHRLTPVYMIVLMIHTNLFHFFGNGPFMVDHIHDVDDCSIVWWKHLLYVQNIWHTKEV